MNFDYDIVEKEHKIGLVPYSGLWKDIGTWDEMVNVMENNVSKNTILADSKNTHVINELEIPLTVLGIDNAVVVATPDGILVSDKKKSNQLKKYVHKSRARFEQREWGEYQILLSHTHRNFQNCIVKYLKITAGNHISYQLHHNRTEEWTIIDGTGTLILNDEIKPLHAKDHIVIPINCKHAVKADTDLYIIELQLGNELSEEDIERLDYEWGNLE